MEPRPLIRADCQCSRCKLESGEVMHDLEEADSEDESHNGGDDEDAEEDEQENELDFLMS